jgi:hypothetical protein
MPKSYEFTMSRECSHCGDLFSIGFARCDNPACCKIRPEFAKHEKVVAKDRGTCIWSGRNTDVRLPNGDWLWAPYFLDALRAGWLDANYQYTPQYLAAKARKKSRKT